MAEQRSLSDLKERSDNDAVRLWLWDRGFVAVERKLMDVDDYQIDDLLDFWRDLRFRLQPGTRHLFETR